MIQRGNQPQNAKGITGTKDQGDGLFCPEGYMRKKHMKVLLFFQVCIKIAQVGK